MNKTKISLIIDSLIISFLISLIISFWAKKYIKSAKFGYFFLILINILLFIAILISLFKSHNKNLFKKNNESFLKKSLTSLIMIDEKNYHTFICNLFNCIKIDQYFFKVDNYFLHINLKANLSPENYFYAQELFLKYKNDDSKLIFIYQKKEKSFDDLISFSNLNFEIISSDCIIKLMDHKKIFPVNKDEIRQVSIKYKIKKYIKTKTSGFQKSHFKQILFSGLSLLFLSLITPFSNYYLLIGTILICLSIIALFKKDYKISKDENIFLDSILKK